MECPSIVKQFYYMKCLLKKNFPLELKVNVTLNDSSIPGRQIIISENKAHFRLPMPIAGYFQITATELMYNSFSGPFDVFVEESMLKKLDYISHLSKVFCFKKIFFS